MRCYLICIAVLVLNSYAWATETAAFAINLSADEESTIQKLAPIQNAGFGSSVAIHADSGDNKWLIVSAPTSTLEAPNDIAYAPRFGSPNRPGSVFRCPFSAFPKDCVLLEYKFETRSGVVQANASNMHLGHSVVTASSGSTAFRSPVEPSARGRYSSACAPLLKSTASQNHPVGSCVLWDSNFRPKVLKTKFNSMSHSSDYRNMFGFSSASYGHKDGDVFVFGVPGHGTVYSGGDDYRATDQGGIVIDVVYGRRLPIEHRVLGFNPTPFEGYAGFSVAISDIFANDAANVITIVVGAPRAGNLTGRVYFINFDVKTQKDTRLEDKTIIGGDEVPMGSQFGYSLLPVDFNADGFVDLLVSAPFAFERNQRAGTTVSSYSTGAVLVYLNLPDQTGQRSLSLLNPVIITPPYCTSENVGSDSCIIHSSKSDSLFGQSLATPGDIDADGILDVAIGAPGENEGMGAVYIYRGSNSGLVFAARLQPISIPSYFGFSLAGGNIDVDGNGYPDLAVGSFGSDQAWVLRSRPIIRIQASLTNSTKRRFLLLDQNYPTVFKLCLEMSSPVELLRPTANSGATLNFSVVLELDSGRQGTGRSRRLTFPDKTSVVKKNVLLLSTPRNPWTLTHCIDDIQVLSSPSIVDPLAPVNITLKIASLVGVQPLDSLLLSGGEGDGKLKALEPVVHPDNTTHVWQVEFDRDCGDDYVCFTDLSIQAEFSKASEEGIISRGKGKFDYERGTSTAESLTLTVQVSNAGEPAYAAKLYVAYSPGLSFRSTPNSNIQCEQAQQLRANSDSSSKIIPPTTKTFAYGRKQKEKKADLVLVCSIGSPFPPKDWPGSVDLIFDVTRSLSAKERFTISVNSSSKEVNPSDDKVVIDLNVYSLAKLMLSAASLPEQLNYSASAEIKGESAMVYFDEVGPVVEHVFIIENAGPAAVRGLSISMAWPAAQECGNELCDRLLYLADDISIRGGLGGFCESGGLVNPSNLRDRPEKLLESQAITEPGSEGRTRRSIGEPIHELCKSNPELKELKNQVRCEAARCRLARLDNNQRTRVTLKFRIWQSTLVKNFQSAQLMVMASKARLEYDATIRPAEGSQLETSANTEVYTIYSATSSALLPSWAIAAVSVALGILIVIILILILWCCGFFKRKTRPAPHTAKVEQQNVYPYAPVPQDIFDSSRL